MFNRTDFNEFMFSRRRLLSFAILALVVGSFIGGALWSLGDIHPLNVQALSKFTSQQELIDFIKKGPEDLPRSLYDKFVSLFRDGFQGGIISVRTPDTFSLEAQDSNGGTEYSTTNVQVEGVDEADVVKTDGEYLYIVSDSVVYILDARVNVILAKLVIDATVAGIFVNQDKLIVFEGGEVFRVYEMHSSFTKTTVHVYDITERSAPILERSITIDGYYFGSRMIGDYVYTIVNNPAIMVNESFVLLPQVETNMTTIDIKASDIYYTDFPNTNDFFTTIMAVNVQRKEEDPVIETYLLGTTSCIFVSMENIYLTAPVYSTTIGTNIHRVRIREGMITYEANGIVPGYVLNQFSMDETNEFRIATTDGTANNVYILDRDLNIIGRLEGLAPGEQIYSARFMGERCYLVTFRKVDPLFVIDLSDPTTPKVLGKLKIPGYSDYLHPYDETHLIGIGKETIGAENGDFSWYQGVKISIFDVSDVAKPKEIAKIEIGDRGTDSPVLRDHKAFLFDRSRNLLVIPILLAEIDEDKYPGGVPPETHGDYVYQGAYVFHISLNDGLVLQGRITHLDDGADLINSGWYFDSPYYVHRSLYIDQMLYTLSDKRVKVNNLDDLTEITVIELT